MGQNCRQQLVDVRGSGVGWEIEFMLCEPNGVATIIARWKLVACVDTRNQTIQFH
jgi:hypothetical protein